MGEKQRAIVYVLVNVYICKHIYVHVCVNLEKFQDFVLTLLKGTV